MARKIKGSVVVITGASSGIGRATALEFAKRGASLVLAARRSDPLETLVVECEAAGGQAHAVPTDVADAAQVEALAAAAVERFGRIDIWVNDAAVAYFGRFDETPIEVVDRTIDTNLRGVMNGVRAALPRLREAGGGVIINVGSALSKSGAPYLSVYSATKFAVAGFAEGIRQELILSGDTNIKVSTILPAAVDTPFYQHAGNYTGRQPKPLNPVYAPETVARAIVSCAEKPKREVYVGRLAMGLTAMRRLSPAMYEQAYARQVELDHFKDEPAADSPGYVLEPVAHGTTSSGGWSQTGEASRGKVTVAGLGVAAVAGTVWLRSRNGHARSGRRWARALRG
jgi:short-subunit dehydrogenase